MKLGIVISCCRNVGSSRYVVETSKYFIKKHELHVFTNNWDPLDPKIRIHKIPTITSNFYFHEASFYFFSTLTMKTQKFDVTLAQPTRYFYPDVGEMQFVYRAWADYKRKTGMPISLGDRILPIIEKQNIERARQIITIAKCVKDEVLRYYRIPKENINVIHSGVNLNQFNPKNKSKYNKIIRDRHGIAENEIVLIFVGNPFHRKGLEQSLEAATKLREDFKFLILGKDELQHNYEELAQKLGIRDRVIFVGLTPEIDKYFAASDIFVFPTLYEPFGLVILEAMASGLPVVTSKLAGAAELIDDGKSGFCIENPKNSEEIAEKLNYLIDNDSLRKQVGRRARQKAEEYSWKVVAKKMLEVLGKAARY